MTSEVDMPQEDLSGCPPVEDLERLAADEPIDLAVADHVARCGSCSALVSEFKTNNLLLAEIRAADSTSKKPPSNNSVDVDIPGIHLLREIHRGGQGIVYLARQSSTNRSVAVKFRHEGHLASVDDRARFDREVQVLSRLKHPNIVTMHDSGTVGGMDYFVMDYIEGLPLDEFLEHGGPRASRAPGESSSPGGLGRGVHDHPDMPDAPDALGIRDRLELFAKICWALSAAHLHGIVHRDLKPGNIRIESNGEPYVLDFGLAKLAAGDSDASMMTVTGQFVGSLPWAAPEQAEGNPGNIDIRTDVYSLGVILYQMLAGCFPYSVVGSMREVTDRILTAIPVPLRSLDRRINDEIETIVNKCLQKDRDRRYQSAGELARDVERYLAGDPIEAKRDSTFYLVKKAVRRHKAAVTLASVVALLIVGSIIALGVMYRNQSIARTQASTEAANAREAESREKSERIKAEQSARLAEAEATKSHTIIDLLQELLAFEDAERVRTPDYPYGRMLDDFSEGLAERLQGQPEVEFVIHLTVGSAYRSIGEFEKSLRSLIKARDIAVTVYGQEHELTADMHRELAMTHQRMGSLKEAETDCREALAILRRVTGDESISTATVLSNLAEILRESGRYAEAEQHGRESVRISQELQGESSYQLAMTKLTLAATLQEVGKLEEAESLLRDVLIITRAIYGDEHPSVAVTMKTLAVVQTRRGDYAGAERLARRSVAILREQLGPTSGRLAEALNTLAVALRAQDDLGGAEPHYREALAINRRLYGDEHPAVAGTRHNLALLLHHQGKYDEAEPLYREVLAQRRRFLGEEHPAVARTMNCLGGLHFVREEYESAEALYRQALEMRLQLLGENHPDVATSYGNLAGAMIRLDQPAEAASLHRKALAVLERAFSRDHRSYKKNLCGLGLALLDQDEYAQAEPLLRECIAFMQEKQVRGSSSLNASSALGAALAGQHRYEEAEPILLAAYEAMSRMVAAPRRHRRDAARRLVSFYEACDRPEQAAHWREEWSALEADHLDGGKAANRADSTPP